ncbi:hypothetical protein [Rhodococcus sp. WS3]|uniref:hypothetical protein n=1 Tax=Rhodococcus sp. WS3 TaxID=2486271 RepID=UPI003966DC3F
MPDVADLDERLVQKPFVAGLGSAAAQAMCVFGPELRAPSADRLVRDDDATGEHQFRNVAQAQGESVDAAFNNLTVLLELAAMSRMDLFLSDLSVRQRA